ncbi:hypothetical protein lerEdw1_008701 [Lerista edwardsae]|nr:hypothetical protein lerEdw1_008701 [Lerista edwardsae]
MAIPAWQKVFGISLRKTLRCLAVAVATFILCSGRGDKYAFTSNHNDSELCRFTVCIDLNRTETVGGRWTAYSYDTSSNSTDDTDIELALSSQNGVMKVYILGKEVELQYTPSPYRMHQMCCVWDGKKSLLEVFHDGAKMLNVTLRDLTHTCLRLGGTLVLGQLHRNQDGHVRPLSGNTFVGILHYFQMWDTVREQQAMAKCEPGNLVSWQGSDWSFSDTMAEPAFHQRCGEVEPTPVAPRPTTNDVPDSTTPVTFYNIQMNFSVSSKSSETFDYYDAVRLSRNWLKKNFSNSEFVVTNHNIMTIEKEGSYSSKSVVKAVSDETTGVLEEKLQKLLHGGYEEENLSMTVDAQDVTITHFGTQTLFLSLIAENAEDVADHILTQLSSIDHSEGLSKKEMQVLVEKLSGIAGCEAISQTLAEKTLKIINIMMTKAGNFQGLQPMVNRSHELPGNLLWGNLFRFKDGSGAFPPGTVFSCPNASSVPQIDIRQLPFETEALASVSLPGLLRQFLKAQSFQPEEHTEIQFNFFGTPELFAEKVVVTEGWISKTQTQLPKGKALERPLGSSFKDVKLNSYVVGASIENVSVQNLADPVIITLKHLKPNVNNSPVHCVFWDLGRNDGSGGWSSSGCTKNNTNTNYTVCECNHLTHFGVLLDLSREPINEADDRMLTLISYVGCGISCIFLGLALVVYLSVDKLCADYPSRILVSLCFALLMLNLAYLVNSWLAAFNIRGLCVAVASALHYFLLAAFTWMGLEALHMYYALVKVFGNYTPNYMLKFSAVGWGKNPSHRRRHRPHRRNGLLRDQVCFQEQQLVCAFNDAVFYVSVVAYFCVIFLTNVAMFVTVFVQIQTMKGRHCAEPTESWRRGLLHDLKRVASLSCLLGLTWGFAFFAWGPVKVFFTYLFAICNTLQDGDGSATMLGYPSRNLKRKPSSHSLRSLKSCATTSTSNSSGGPLGASPNMNGRASDRVSCHTSCTPSLCQSTKFPHVRRISLLDIELHQPHKMGLVS